MDGQALEPWWPRKRPRGPSCSSSAAMDYDVFLNHRGPGAKAGFVVHLDEALRTAGLNPFLDKASSREGDRASSSINEALEAAKVHVAVVSKGYAESKYCLNELVAMMRTGKPVLPVFYEVEPAHLRWVEKGPFAAAFEKHKSKRTPEQVEEWRDALRQLAGISGFCFGLSDCQSVADEVELKRELVDAILRKLAPTFAELQVDQHLVGMAVHVNTCVKKLEKMSNGTCVLGLVGMGGVGKTSLAKVIYNHFVGYKRFQAKSYLEIDGNSPSSMEVGPSMLKRLQRQLLWDLLHVPINNEQSYNYWFYKLSNKGPVLVILDDINETSQFDDLILNTSYLAQGSCIIVTSRDQHVLKVIGRDSNIYLHEVTPLGSDDSQKLFNLNAFHCEEALENFKAIANDVSDACGGLPLALKVVGSSLFDKRSDEDLKHIWPEAVDALKGDQHVMNALRWSYDRLLDSEKLMFVDIACVFCGWKKKEAVEIWKSCKGCSSCCGYETPYMTLRNLIDRSLIVLNNLNGNDVLAMHGLLRNMGQGIGILNGSHLWDNSAKDSVEEVHEGPNKKVRALNLANSWKRKLECENFAKMSNLHYLILDGCDISGNFDSFSKELRWLQWRNMPLTHLPPMFNFVNLVSLDFSKSTRLASIWSEANPALEACPNLLRLNLQHCTSITTLPDSIGRLSRLQNLNLFNCRNLQKLPTSIGLLTELEELWLQECESLEALPDSISGLSKLQWLLMHRCSSISKLPPTMGLMTAITYLNIDLATEWQALAVGQLGNALNRLLVMNCTDEAITALDSSSSLSNLQQLFFFGCYDSPTMTKLPDTIGLLTNLDYLDLYDCEKLRALPNSMGQLKVLMQLFVRKCNNLEGLPDCLGELRSLEELWIVNCPCFSNLPTSIGHLGRLRELRIEGCGELRPLPDSLRQLHALGRLGIMDCGSLEGLGLVRALGGFRMWGCTSIAQLPGSCLMVVDENLFDPGWYLYDDDTEYGPVREDLKELRVVEACDCGLLRHVQDSQSSRFILQRVYSNPCCKLITL